MTEWDRIVDEHGPLVWRTAVRLLGNEADAAMEHWPEVVRERVITNITFDVPVD